ncbi:dihydroorotate dehydrogenase electron transfer subunit [Methanocella sp. CWC-04]|uniref:Probable dihydroorotate dehydrogenase B (NAD(+)), electron transfer subunit n=1 Tax=Methanooceanicella nereidis TaxID=2052831 RepID=A0AAP2RB90_9EURY|nr:dihydroorotate dehydrogenase electron transfer subunit [Methanocella sp. CWC-04]MCD1293842.1 dihydroorotate dehydrogenase electron transfer subunit [Methanocella sp. CWC-04]
MRPISSTITEIIDETPTIKTFRLDVSHWLNGRPGQYVMVWVRGVDEVPMTLSYDNAITVQKVGEATEALFGLNEGDSVGIRGPYGNGWELVGDDILIVSGGVGSAPLAPFAEKAASAGVSVTTVAGYRTKEEVHFDSRFRKSGKTIIATDDGSYGHKGFVTELLKTLDLSSFSQIYCCGPEKMMFRVLGILDDAGVASRSQFSLQRYIKCGLGVCGSCCMDPEGLRVCRDGPVFKGDVLIDSEMGRYTRDASGRRINI